MASSRLSMAARLTIWFVGLTSFVIVVVATFLYIALDRILDWEDANYLADKVHTLIVMVRQEPGTAHLTRILEQISPPRPEAVVHARILDADGKMLQQSKGMPLELAIETFPSPTPRSSLHTGTIERIMPSGHAYILLTVKIDPDPDWILQLAFDRTEEEQLLASFRIALMILLGLTLASNAGFGYLIARRGLRPIAAMTHKVRDIGSTTLDRRLELADWPSELATLATSFNSMLDRLQDSFERLGQFSADIAHELRTPVNNLRGEVEVALRKPRTADEYRQLLESCLEEAGRLSRLIDSLLFLARAESPKAQIQAEAIQLSSMFENAREFYAAAADEAGISLSIEGQLDIHILVDRELFQRALGNLIGNAIAHTPAGGRIVLAAMTENRSAVIEVRDTGSGISAEHIEHVFDRFYRADPARSAGTGRVGLGLALVKSIVSLHGGSILAISSPGRGTIMRLTLPLAIDWDSGSN